MSVKLRMKRMGTKKRPFYRVVAIDSRMARDGRFIDIVGFYNPMVNPPEIKMDDDKVYNWLRNGAVPSEKVRELFRRIGLMEKWSLVKKGVSIADLDAKLEERRAKQPRPAADKEKKKRPNKKQAAKAAAEKAAAKSEESA
ncbi:MAG: 30S ribosomal protein S16 [Candidatus Latescibacterota bacterium]|nr:MAG: 30S ribosomal protein S16 [Candidatus Latescibacterota bacterium]